MLQTATGSSVFNAMNKAAYPVSVHLNTTDVVLSPNGSPYLGQTKTSYNQQTNKITKTDITIYEKPLVQSVVDGKISLNGKDVNVKGLTPIQLDAGGLVHEGTHATDPKSNSMTNSGATQQEREVKPYQNQENYYQELEQTPPTNGNTPSSQPSSIPSATPTPSTPQRNSN